MTEFKGDKTVYKGRPNPLGRLEKEMKVYDLLEKFIKFVKHKAIYVNI